MNMATGEPVKIQRENWQEYQPSLVSTILYLYKSKILSDIVFLVVEDEKMQKRYFAHKFILSIRSAVFESMFSCSKNKVIIIFGISCQGFETMLRFLYTDNMNLTNVKQAIDAYRAAKTYNLPLMEKQCKDYISDRVTIESVCQIYELIDKKEMSEVLYKCLIIISKNAEKVLKSHGFLNSHWTTVQMIANRSNIALDSEYNLFNAILNWSKNECIRRNIDIKNHFRSTIEPFLFHIRFLAMFPLEYAKIINDTNLFDINEAFPILLKLLLPKASVSLPKYLNCKMSTRNFFNYFTCRPFLKKAVSERKDSLRMLKVNDIFNIKFQILKIDIFLLGVTLPLLQHDEYEQKLNLKTNFQIKFLNSIRTEECSTEINLSKYKEPFLAFPYPIFIKEGENVNIKVKMQSVEKSSSVSIFKYQELVAKFQYNEEIFIFSCDNLDESGKTHQISSLRYFI